MKKLSVWVLAAMTASTLVGWRANAVEVDMDSLRSAHELEATVEQPMATEEFAFGHGGPGHGGPGFRPGPGHGGPGYHPGYPGPGPGYRPGPGYPYHPGPGYHPPIYPPRYIPAPRPYPYYPGPHLFTCYSRGANGVNYSGTDYSPSNAQYEANRQCNIWSNYCSDMGCN